MIRDEKFRKKIDAKNRTGTTYGQKGPSFIFWLLSAALRKIEILFNVYLPLLPIPIFTFIEKIMPYKAGKMCQVLNLEATLNQIEGKP